MTATAGFADPFSSLLGAHRGYGDTRLDRDQLTRGAHARREHVLAQAYDGNLDPACVLLSEHRRQFAHPQVAALIDRLVDAAATLEAGRRQEWLADFVHATVRDGRDGRVVRVQTGMRDPQAGTPGAFDTHLRPDANVDSPAHARYGTEQTIPAAFCGAEHFQRATVGAWSGDHDDHNYIYTRCPKCESVAGEVPEAYDPYAGTLPAAEMSLLAAEHRSAVAGKLRGGLRRSKLDAAKLSRYAADTYIPSAVTAAVAYAMGGGDDRLNTFCASFIMTAGRARRDKGYEGELSDLLDAEFFTQALRARTPRRSNAGGSWRTPAKTGRATWHTRRTRFAEAVGDALHHSVQGLDNLPEEAPYYLVGMDVTVAGEPALAGLYGPFESAERAEAHRSGLTENGTRLILTQATAPVKPADEN